jgi:two-component system, cell cycle response regulator
MKILIAEDDSMSRKLLQKTLEKAGYEVIAVENGRLAQEELTRKDGPRMALLDWEMPEADGPTVCRAVRGIKDKSYVYMIFLTSKESNEDKVAGLQAGADDYLTKPFNVEELKARLRSGLRILHLEDRLVEAREEMRFKATHDALTGLWNRGVITELLEGELTRAHRERKSTAVLLCDIDHFKKVNDTHGHPVGDEVLREVAKRLQASVRSYDFVGRYGGEEFLIILNNCQPTSSLARAEQMRETIARREITTDSGPLNLTMSFGLLRSIDWQGASASACLSEVDLALYAAKSAGRNCVRVALPPKPAQSEPAESAPIAEKVHQRG